MTITATQFVRDMFAEARDLGVEKGVWDLLSAIRGPDNATTNELKLKLTEPVRQALEVRDRGGTPYTVSAVLDWKQIERAGLTYREKGSSHYLMHIQSALTQLHKDLPDETHEPDRKTEVD